MKKALFAGSFDPFTLGHQSIVERTLSLADEVIIGIGNNADKRPYFSAELRKRMISALFEDEPRVSVQIYNGLTTDFAKDAGATFLVRGVRSVSDFEFERCIADVNRQLTGIDTVLLFTEPQLSSISSSIVRELLSYGKDVSAFVPEKLKISQYTKQI